MLGFIKKIFFWSYGRSTWQYDVLCALILAFIFLTPKAWFENSERARSDTHQTSSTSAKWLVIWPESLPATPDAQEIERRAQQLTGRADVRVKGVRPVKNGDGATVAYEVDID